MLPVTCTQTVSLSKIPKRRSKWFEDWRLFYETINPEAFTVGEVWTDLQVTAKYAQGMNSLFMFDLAEDIKGGIFAPDPSRIIKSYLDTLTYFPDGHFSTFLSNHDQQRVMSLFTGDLQKAKLAAYIYLTGPGVPFIYYGEEIGMLGNKPDELLRTPMQWSGEPGAGFTSGTPWQPQNDDYQEVNVDLQDGNPDALLTQYRSLVQLQKWTPSVANRRLPTLYLDLPAAFPSITG
jgi:alpha-amylase